MKSEFSHAIQNTKVQFILKLILGGVFVYAGIGKILYREQFLEIIKNYKLLPIEYAKLLAIILPYLEICFGSLLVLNFFVKISSLVLIIMLVVFIVSILSTLVRGINVECGCFINKIANKNNSLLESTMAILRDIAFIIIGILVYKNSKKNL